MYKTRKHVRKFTKSRKHDFAKTKKHTHTSNDSPRTRYANQYHKSVWLSPEPLFQVSFYRNQFVHYKRITENTSVECFVQTLFALGLRNIYECKKDIEKIDFLENGTLYDDAAEYLDESFGLNGQITHTWYTDTSDTNYFDKDCVSFMNTYLKTNLKNNFATILTVDILKTIEDMDEHSTPYEYEILDREGCYTYGHYIIAYKHRNTLWYFDPQNRKHTRFMDKIVKGQIVDVGGFDVRVDSPTPLKSTTCPLNLYG